MKKYEHAFWHLSAKQYVYSSNIGDSIIQEHVEQMGKDGYALAVVITIHNDSSLFIFQREIEE